MNHDHLPGSDIDPPNHHLFSELINYRECLDFIWETKHTWEARYAEIQDLDLAVTEDGLYGSEWRALLALYERVRAPGDIQLWELEDVLRCAEYGTVEAIYWSADKLIIIARASGMYYVGRYCTCEGSREKKHIFALSNMSRWAKTTTKDVIDGLALRYLTEHPYIKPLIKLRT